ncbi:MAG: hypothetical protein KGI28_08385 [Thaumarchaeota archaeon]|nr:hypothetical protein [Nitrososphaerota archaeon]
MELSEILYSAISDYGEHRILSDIVQGESPEVIKVIFEHCVSNIGKFETVKPDTSGSIAEGLLHYMLTVSMIPSQRKTSFQSVDIDIAVPDTRTLGVTPQDVVVILFPKTDNVDNIKSHIEKIKKVQPNANNIWVVLENSPQLDAKVYSLKDSMTFSNIINDLISFSSNRKQSKLKIFKI